jgi:hypothetical protein
VLRLGQRLDPHRVVEQSQAEHRAQDAQHRVVDP